MQEYPTFDAYSALVRRRKEGEDTTLPPIQEYAPEDILELESFCRKYGIVGFNFGRMHPKAALRMLKSRMGIPLEDNVSENKIKTLLKG